MARLLLPAEGMKVHPTPEQAVSHITSESRIFVHGGAATPNTLLRELENQAGRLRNVELIHLHTLGPARYAMPEYSQSFQVTNLFVGPNIRPRMGAPNIHYIPCFLSEIPQFFRSGVIPIDIALIHVSPPDEHGWCSLGTSVDVAAAAIQCARTIIAQINPRMPRVFGDGMIHSSQIQHAVEVKEEIPEDTPRPPNDIELRIGAFAASLIEDGSTLQAGIGAVPEAVLSSLRHHRHLGVHTEMWSDGTLKLIQAGVIDNSRKCVIPGKTVSGFAIGSRALYDFIDDNPSVLQLDIGFVNDPGTIRQNPKVVSINSAVEIDLTGQVCSDSVGRRIVSGVGGQMDFVRGATLSPGGKSIIALTSRTGQGKSRIVPYLQQGAGVVTTRAHVHYIITEYGIAELWGKTLQQRARSLISIAHPEDREMLERSRLC